MKKNLSLSSRLKSVSYAGSGISHLIIEEPNAKLHLIATIMVTCAGVIKGLTASQWIAIILAIAIVWITEALNTCIELLCNFACKGEIRPEIKVIKDIAAGAVLVASIASVIIASFIFLN